MAAEHSGTSSDLLILITNLVSTVAQKAQRQKPLTQKRTDQRYPLNLAVGVSCHAPAGEFRAEYYAWGLDLSYQGIGLLVERKLEPQTLLYLSLKVTSLGNLVFPARVVSCRHLAGNIHRAGVAFVFDP